MLEYLMLYKMRLTGLLDGLSFICISSELRVYYATEDFTEIGNFASENISLKDCKNFSDSTIEILKTETGKDADEKNRTFFKIMLGDTEKDCMAVKSKDGFCIIFFFSGENLCEQVAKASDFLGFFFSTHNFNCISLPIVVTQKSHIVYCNTAFTKLTGYSLSVIHHMKLSKLAMRDTKGAVEALESGEAKDDFTNASFMTQLGSVFNAQIYAMPIFDNSSKINIIFDRKSELQNTFMLKMFMSAASYSNDGICIFDTDYNLFWLNSSFEKMTGFNKENMAPVFEYLKRFEGEFKSHITNHEYWYRMDNISTAYGESFCAEMYIHEINSKYLCLCLENSNEKLQATQILRSFKSTDYLTGLDNAISFRNRLSTEYDKCSTQPDCLNVIMFSIVNYTDISFSMNPQTADDVLKNAAQRAKSIVGDKGYIARLGEYRFGIMFRTKNDEDAMSFLNEFIVYMDTPILHEESSYHLKICASLCSYPSFASELATLYSASSTLLDAAIVSKKSCYAYYSDEGDVIIKKYVSAFESEIESSMENDDFLIQYQPIYSSESAEKIIALDALLRTKSSRAATNVSRSFLNEADTTGAIVQIGYKMLENVVSHIAARLYDNKPVVPVYFNVSFIQLSDDTFADTLLQTLEKYGLASSYLIIQLRFDDVKHHISELRQRLSELNERGIKFSITYFTGKETLLESLCRVGVRTVKFEKSFTNPNVDELARRTKLLIDAAKKYDTRIIASGIETMEHLDNAMQFNIDCVQGYLFSMPLSLDVVDEMINKQ